MWSGWLLTESRESERLHFYCKLKGFFYAESLFLSNKKVGFFNSESLVVRVASSGLFRIYPTQELEDVIFFFFLRI